MSQYILKGIVHPERAPLSVGPIRPHRVVHLNSDREIGVELNITLNQITVWIDSEDEWNPYDLRNTARNFAMTICATLSFIRGYNYEVEILQLLCKEKSTDQVFGIDVPCVSERVSRPALEERFPSVLIRTGGQYGIYFSRCFKDLNLALKDTEDTAFYCFRAIETLRKYCGEKFGIKKEEEQWKKLWDITGLDRGYIAKINSHANDSRHGQHVDASEADRVEFLTRSWDVVEKLIENDTQNIAQLN